MPGKKKETDEERAGRRDTEAAAAAASERQRQAAAVERLRERAAREDAYTRNNIVKINSHWRNLMRQAKTADLRGDLDIIRQSFERALDRKDAIIQALDADLEEAEEQWRNAVKGHSQVLDSLKQLQASRLHHAKHHFDASLQAMKEEFEAEKVELVSRHAHARKEMLEVQVAMEAAHAEAAAEARQEFEEAREEVRNRASEEYNVLKLSLEGQIAELEAAFKAAHQIYLHETQERSQAFKQLTNSDQEAAAVIEMRLKKLLALNEALSHWRAKINSGAREWEARNRAIAAEKAAIARHHRSMNAGMARSRALQAARLRQLSLVSTVAEKEVQEKLELAQQILHVGQLCHKLMREGERIHPFCSAHQALYPGPAPLPPLPSSSGVPQAKGEKCDSEPGNDLRRSESLVEARLDDRKTVQLDPADSAEKYDELAQVLLGKLALEQESRQLDRKTQQLRSALQTFLDGVSVGSGAVDFPTNTLLDINGRLQKSLRSSQGSPNA